MDIQINYYYFISIFIAVIIIFIIVVIIIVIIIIIVTIIVILERLNWWKLTQMFHVISPTMESITARVEKSCKFSCLGIKTMWSLQLLLLLLLLLLLHYYFLYLWNFKCQVEFNPIQLQEKTDQKNSGFGYFKSNYSVAQQCIKSLPQESKNYCGLPNITLSNKGSVDICNWYKKRKLWREARSKTNWPLNWLKIMLVMI